MQCLHFTKAQCCHATLGVYELMIKNGHRKLLLEWKLCGQPKVVVSVKDLDEMMEVQNKAIEYDLPHYLVRDAGKTQLESGTYTVLAVGPAPNEILDEITGQFKLM
ncbi:hypothetical protein RFI_09631 [Reticulomyxa filosa]|uniref:peptidyl-tRNA hydrolase n=1 Tax=Reticulomyxa filosa TaxID=46433 RepID=X6NML7_RETFI|nr:hypothetical protein RFI_09631 [Reticulomyxa filosa]|eukprot:ETO27500.1 hypothetical protein RFI_09631 [Reticulomyxa filosa]